MVFQEGFQRRLEETIKETTLECERLAAEEAARRSPAADEVPAVDTTDVATFILISSVILSSFTIIGVSDLLAHIDWP